MMKGMILMQTSIYAQNINPYSTTSEINFSLELPTKCPNSTYFCPTCGNCFFIVYSVEKLHHDLFGFPLVQYPTPSETTSFSKEISMLTPKFIEIYQQAEKAENSGLTELCGIGYRKALEFLVKDYAISNHPNSKEQIESFMLGKCITDYIDNEKIKTLAKASAWLGNDETHYVRKHQNYNVQDLKRFIKATVAYIEYELSFTEAFDLLKNPQ